VRLNGLNRAKNWFDSLLGLVCCAEKETEESLQDIKEIEKRINKEI
jgi:hypothetical protein